MKFPSWLKVIAMCALLAACEPSGATLDTDLYESAIDAIDDADRYFPTTKPTNAEYVTLVALDGKPMFAVQHRNINVAICELPPCLANAHTIRTFEHNKTTYTIQYAALGQIPDSEPYLDPEIRSFWEAAEFTSERPDWLTMALYPGR